MKFEVGSIVSCWHLTEDPILVTHIVHLDEYTSTSFVHYPAGDRIIGKSFRKGGHLHEFWFMRTDVTQVLS